MAIVNKFNVNKQEVTLDPDIIENMSANDVSYNASTQYDENTVGDKLNKLSELEEEIYRNYKYPDIPKDEFYNLPKKYFIGDFYFTPERNVRRLTGISFKICSNWIPTDSVKIVAYKPNDVIILKEIIATRDINEIIFEEPITCDDEHEIAVYLSGKPGDSSWYLYNYDGGVWYRADSNGTVDFQPQSNYSSAWDNTLIGVQFYNSVSISEEVDELKKESSYYVTNTEFEKVKSLAESKADDFFTNKMVIFSGDSWSQGTYESRSKVYRTVFAALHPSCIVEDKSCISGSTIADRGAGLGSISTRVKGRIEQYGDKFVNSYYPLTTSDNISTATPGGRIILDVDRLDYLRFKFDLLGVLNNSIRIYFYSYNQSNSKYTELTNVWQYVEGTTDENAAIVTIMLASQIKALDGETLAIKLKYNSYSWTDTNVKVVNDESKQYNIEGVITAGSPLLTYGYKGDMDYLIIEGGLNDCYGSYPLGVLSEGYDSTYDRTTFYGALEDMFSDIVKKSPSTKTGFIIMPMADTLNWGTYVEAIKAACDKWGIVYLDLDGLMRARLVGMGLNSDSIYWSIYPDGNTNPHPSAYGYEMMNSKIFSWMNTL